MDIILVQFQTLAYCASFQCLIASIVQISQLVLSALMVTIQQTAVIVAFKGIMIILVHAQLALMPSLIALPVSPKLHVMCAQMDMQLQMEIVTPAIYTIIRMLLTSVNLASRLFLTVFNVMIKTIARFAQLDSISILNVIPVKQDIGSMQMYVIFAQLASIIALNAHKMELLVRYAQSVINWKIKHVIIAKQGFMTLEVIAKNALQQ